VREPLPTPGARIRGTQDEAEIASREHRKGRSWMHIQLEAKLHRIERNGRIDIIDDIPGLDCSHNRAVWVRLNGPRISCGDWFVRTLSNVP
jgi:hypothetical protein